MTGTVPNPAVPMSRADCAALDQEDPLRGLRARFALPEGIIYLDGHSLGPATHGALERTSQTAGAHWRDGLIRSWNSAGWFDLPATAGAKLARLIGARPDEVLVTDSVTVNLFKLAGAALGLASRRVLLSCADDFPTDQYVMQGLHRFSAAPHVRLDAPTPDDLAANPGVLVKSLVNYRTGEVADPALWERAAQAAGAVIVWDLSHAVGALDLDLSAAGVRLATGCTYKFLNGGPGAPAFVHVRQDVRARSPISGWFAARRPFDFSPDFDPRAGAAGFAAGTPPVLSLAALDAALDAFAGVDMAHVQDKARRLGQLVIARCDALGLEPLSPREGQRRGGHVSIRHPQGYAIVQALIARGVIPDFRAPDAMRFGLAPFYVRYCDVWDAMDALASVLAERAWDAPAFLQRGGEVT